MGSIGQMYWILVQPKINHLKINFDTPKLYLNKWTKLINYFNNRLKSIFFFFFCKQTYYLFILKSQILNDK